VILFTSIIHDYPINFHDTEDSAFTQSKANPGSIDVALDTVYRYCSDLSCSRCPLNSTSCDASNLLTEALLDPTIAAAYPELAL